MKTLTGYIWKTTGVWERHLENGGMEVQTCEAEFLVYHEDKGGGVYVLTDDDEAPFLNWGEVERYIPEKTSLGADLVVLECDEYAGYTVWIGEADGKTNEVTVVVN